MLCNNNKQKQNPLILKTLFHVALYTLYSDTTRDSETRNMANSLLLKIKSFKFICSI
jgi:hypothetical protein